MRKASGFIPTGKLKNKHTDGRHQQLRILTLHPPPPSGWGCVIRNNEGAVHEVGSGNL